jgi:WD40 repeat protein
VYSAAFSPDGKTLVSASLDRSVRVWDVATQACLAEMKGHAGAIWQVGRGRATAPADCPADSAGPRVSTGVF